MYSIKNLVFLIFVVNFNSILGNNDWSGEKWLNQDYHLKWRNNEIDKSLTIRVEVKTNGWVGFGFSKHGKTTEADMAIGWVDNKGNPVLNDFWVNELGSRELDQSQDWHLLSGEENSTHTIFELERNYRTCDTENDLEIYENDYEMSNIVFAYSLLDPQSIETIGGPHIEAVLHLNLFFDDNEFEPKETDLVQYNYWINFTLPPEGTKMCKLIENNAPFKHMIVKFNYELYPAHIGQNHHFVFFQCNEAKDLDNALMDNLVGKIFPCYNLSFTHIRNMCQDILLQSPIRSLETFFFPEMTGITNDPDKYPYVLLEAHMVSKLNSPQNMSATLKTWITRQFRNFESSHLGMGAAAGFVYDNWGILIPPKVAAYKLAIAVDSFCISLDPRLENGIYIYANFYHTHAGHYMEIRHYRNDRMLRSLRYNNYDFEYQPYRPVRPHINFRETDKIVVICEFNSLNVTKSYTAPKEHCIFATFYYPKIDRQIVKGYMFSRPTYNTWIKVTGLGRIDGFGLTKDQTIIREPAKFNNTKLLDFIADNNYKIKDPVQLEKLLMSEEMEVCCDFQTKDSPCKKHMPPPNLYNSIVRERVENSCDSSDANELNEAKVDRLQTESNNQWIKSFKGLKFSLKFFVNYFKLFFNFEMF